MQDGLKLLFIFGWCFIINFNHTVLWYLLMWTFKLPILIKVPTQYGHLCLIIFGFCFLIIDFDYIGVFFYILRHFNCSVMIWFISYAISSSSFYSLIYYYCICCCFSTIFYSFSICIFLFNLAMKSDGSFEDSDNYFSWIFVLLSYDEDESL